MKKNKSKIILKDLDGWVEVLIFDPITLPLVRPLSKLSKNPLHYTFISIILTLVASFFLIKEEFIYAAILYFLSIMSDGVDGKIARYNNKNIIIHGVLDVLTDQLRNGIYLVALYISLPEYRLFLFIYILLQLTYEFSFCVRLELKTRFFEDQPRGYSLIELKKYYEGIIFNKTNKLNNVMSLYNKLFNFSSKFRTFPFPTFVDSEFILLVIFVIFPNPFIAYLVIIFLLPDVLMSLFLSITLALKMQKKSELNK